MDQVQQPKISYSSCETIHDIVNFVMKTIVIYDSWDYSRNLLVGIQAQGS